MPDENDYLAGLRFAFGISTPVLAPHDRNDFTDALAWEERRRELAQLLERNNAQQNGGSHD